MRLGRGEAARPATQTRLPGHPKWEVEADAHADAESEVCARRRPQTMEANEKRQTHRTYTQIHVARVALRTFRVRDRHQRRQVFLGCACILCSQLQPHAPLHNCASAGNRTRVTSMATMYSTTRPLMLLSDFLAKIQTVCRQKMRKDSRCAQHTRDQRLVAQL